MSDGGDLGKIRCVLGLEGTDADLVEVVRALRKERDEALVRVDRTDELRVSQVHRAEKAEVERDTERGQSSTAVGALNVRITELEEQNADLRARIDTGVCDWHKDSTRARECPHVKDSSREVEGLKREIERLRGLFIQERAVAEERTKAVRERLKIDSEFLGPARIEADAELLTRMELAEAQALTLREVMSAANPLVCGHCVFCGADDYEDHSYTICSDPPVEKKHDDCPWVKLHKAFEESEVGRPLLKKLAMLHVVADRARAYLNESDRDAPVNQWERDQELRAALAEAGFSPRNSTGYGKHEPDHVVGPPLGRTQEWCALDQAQDHPYRSAPEPAPTFNARDLWIICNALGLLAGYAAVSVPKEVVEDIRARMERLQKSTLVTLGTAP